MRAKTKGYERGTPEADDLSTRPKPSSGHLSKLFLPNFIRQFNASSNSSSPSQTMDYRQPVYADERGNSHAHSDRASGQPAFLRGDFDGFLEPASLGGTNATTFRASSAPNRRRIVPSFSTPSLPSLLAGPPANRNSLAAGQQLTNQALAALAGPGNVNQARHIRPGPATPFYQSGQTGTVANRGGYQQQAEAGGRPYAIDQSEESPELHGGDADVETLRGFVIHLPPTEMPWR